MFEVKILAIYLYFGNKIILTLYILYNGCKNIFLIFSIFMIFGQIALTFS